MSAPRRFAEEAIDISELATAELNGIGDLLDVLGLARYRSIFQQEDIDIPTLFYMQDEHFISLGLSLSERVKILRCIQLLKDVPPPPASMAMKWRNAEAAAPARPPPRVRFVEKPEEVHGDPIAMEADEYKDEPMTEEQPIEQEALTEEEPQYEAESRGLEEVDANQSVETAAAVAAAAAIAGVGAGSAMAYQQHSGGEPKHSLVILRSEESDSVSLHIGERLQEAFEDQLGVIGERVLFAVTDDGRQFMLGLDSCLDASSPEDDVLWIVFTGSHAVPGEIMPDLRLTDLINRVEERYRGQRAIIVLDTCTVPDMSDEQPESKANPDLKLALFYAALSPRGDASPENKCYLALCLLDTLRGRVSMQNTEERYTIKNFVDDARAKLEWVGLCLAEDGDVDDVLKFDFTLDEDFSEDNLVMVPHKEVRFPSLHNSATGLRGLYEGRPVQIIAMNGPTRVEIRFLDQDVDTEWVGLSEVTLEGAGDEHADAVSGRGLPPPLPSPSASERQSSTHEGEIALGEQEDLSLDVAEQEIETSAVIDTLESPAHRLQSQDMMEEELEPVQSIVEDTMEDAVMNTDATEPFEQEEILVEEHPATLEEAIEDSQMIVEEIPVEDPRMDEQQFMTEEAMAEHQQEIMPEETMMDEVGMTIETAAPVEENEPLALEVTPRGSQDPVLVATLPRGSTVSIISDIPSPRILQMEEMQDMEVDNELMDVPALDMEEPQMDMHLEDLTIDLDEDEEMEDVATKDQEVA